MNLLRSKYSTLQKRQRGTVLVTVLLVVAFVAILVVDVNQTVVYQANLNRNLMHRDQAYSYLVGMEEIAKIYLKKAFDAEKEDIVHLGQPWAQQDITFPIDGGAMSATVVDMQACLNLNAISIIDSKNNPPNGGASPEQNPPTRSSPNSEEDGKNPAVQVDDDKKKSITQEILTELLEKIMVDTEKRPSALAEEVRDWIDQDFTPSGTDGAEDLYYQGLTVPYLPPNGPIAHISELRAIKSFDRKTYEQLKEYICILPGGKDYKLNVNTISEERSELLSAALGGKVSAADVKRLISARPKKGYTMQEFWDELGDEAKVKTGLRNRLDVTSNYFQMNAKAEINNTRVYLKTLFVREEDNRFKVVSRYFGKE